LDDLKRVFSFQLTNSKTQVSPLKTQDEIPPPVSMSDRRARHDAALDAARRRIGGRTQTELPRHMAEHMRQLGHLDHSRNRNYVRGARMGQETCEVLLGILRNDGFYCDEFQHQWTAAEKRVCPSWKAVRNYVNRNFLEVLQGSSNPRLNIQGRLFLRNLALCRPKLSLEVYRVHLFRQTHVRLSESRISTLLHLMGLSRQKLYKIATQRDSPQNQQYARAYAYNLRQNRYQKLAWFDQAGMNKKNMNSRRNDGWAEQGAGGAFMSSYLAEWTQQNLTVQGFMDCDGYCCSDVHWGGTDWAYLFQYFQQCAPVLRQRGVDGIVLDNAPMHDTFLIRALFFRYGIKVIFLPRYWPQVYLSFFLFHFSTVRAVRPMMSFVDMFFRRSFVVLSSFLLFFFSSFLLFFFSSFLLFFFSSFFFLLFFFFFFFFFFFINVLFSLILIVSFF